MSTRFPDEMAPDELDAFRAVAKETLRKRMSALRRALPEDARAERASAMCARVIAHDVFVRAQVIAAYAPLRFEIDPGAIVRAAWAAGKTVALPRVDPETRTFTLHRYQEGDALEESGHVIREPSAEAPLIATDAVELVLVPALAYDGSGYRLGFGQGYYDRMLPHMHAAVRLGLAYDLSLLPEIPHAAHDVPVHFVATCRRLFRSA